ncbi:MAG: serine hydrolase domain-containing protein, partial [Pseudomonadota bacterium]
MKLLNGFSRRSFILSAGVSALFSGGCAEYSNVSELGADAATGSERDLFSRSEAAFAKASRRGLPGAIIAVQRGEEPAQIRAYGLADVDDALPMQIEMWMRIGSVSKLFVGYIVLKLIDEGVLDLDQPVSDFRNDVPSADKITLLMLGNHTSGLFNPIYSKEFRAKINQ